MAVMEGDSAVRAVFGERADDPELAEETERMRDDYEHQLDAKFAGARGFVDAILTPEDTREHLAFVLSVVGQYRGPHLGAFVLPPLDYAQERS